MKWSDESVEAAIREFSLGNPEYLPPKSAMRAALDAAFELQGLLDVEEIRAERNAAYEQGIYSAMGELSALLVRINEVMSEIIRISDRKTDAWDNARSVLADVRKALETMK